MSRASGNYGKSWWNDGQETVSGGEEEIENILGDVPDDFDGFIEKEKCADKKIAKLWEASQYAARSEREDDDGGGGYCIHYGIYYTSNNLHTKECEEGNDEVVSLPCYSSITVCLILMPIM